MLQQPTKPDSTTKKAGFNNQNSRIQQPWLQQPKKPVSTTKRFNNQGFNNQQSRIQQPKPRIQQPKPRIQQPQSSTTKGSTTKRVEFNNQGSTTKMPASKTKGGVGGGLIAYGCHFHLHCRTPGSRGVGWGGWGIASLRFPLPFALSKSWKNGCGVGWVGG